MSCGTNAFMHNDNTKRRRTSVFAALLLLTSTALCALFLRDPVLGVHIGGSALDAYMSPVESLRYRFFIRQTTVGDQAAMKNLADFDCGGGAGCYDHGEVVVHVMRTMGDRAFSTTATGLDSKDKQALLSLLLSGIEYGCKDDDGIDMRKDFALTAAVLGF